MVVEWIDVITHSSYVTPHPKTLHGTPSRTSLLGRSDRNWLAQNLPHLHLHATPLSLLLYPLYDGARPSLPLPPCSSSMLASTLWSVRFFPFCLFQKGYFTPFSKNLPWFFYLQYWRSSHSWWRWCPLIHVFCPHFLNHFHHSTWSLLTWIVFPCGLSFPFEGSFHSGTWHAEEWWSALRGASMGKVGSWP